MKKRLAAFLLILYVIMTFTSCNTVSSIDRLLSPPKFTELQTELLDALEQGLKTDVGNVILKYPNYGDGEEVNRKAFILCDIDGDEMDETIVFHQSKESTGAEIIMNVLDNIGGKWVWMCDTEQRINTEYSRSEILNVIFEDLNGDGVNEIITEWSLSTSTNRCFIIMNYVANDEGGAIDFVCANEYSRLLACDLNHDGLKEIFTTQINFMDKTSTAFLYKMYNNAVIPIMETQLDGSVTSYAPLIAGSLYGSSKPAVYADGYKANNEMITEVIFCNDDNTELRNPFYASSVETSGDGETKISGSVTATLRSVTLLTADVNGDGYPDIPFSEPLPLNIAEDQQNKTELQQEAAYLTTYASFTGNEILFLGDSIEKNYSKNQSDQYKYDNSSYGEINSYIVAQKDEYRFKFPISWQGCITARYNAQSRSLIFSEFNSQTDTAGNDIAEIRTFSLSDWHKNSADYTDGGYSPINESDSNKKYVYAIKLLNSVQNSSISVNKGIMTNNFSVIAY